MGNIQNNATRKDPNIFIQDLSTIKLQKRMGPCKLPFAQLSPKHMQSQTEIQFLEADEKWDDSDVEDSQIIPTRRILEQESRKVIEEIKIKWNSFIKMKTNDYHDQYEVLKQLGRGGYGTVFKVKAKYTGVLRAAKKIKKADLAQDGLQRLLGQMSIMIDLDHPNVARLFEVYGCKSYFVLILELCQGGQLFKKLAMKRLTQDDIVQSMTQLLRALQYLHSRGIVHRDLKPENILFEKDTNAVKLIDFGIATRYNAKQQPLTTRIGTPFYIAPEVLCKRYTEKCDVWSLGVIFYMMLSSNAPFTGQSELQIMHNILATDPIFKGPTFSGVSKQAIDLLKSLLIKNPDHRPSAFQAYNHPYIQNNLAKKAVNTSYERVLDTIYSFNFNNRLQAVVYTFIVSQILTSEQKKQMRLVFQQLDKDRDGVLSLSELKMAFDSRKDMSDKKIGSLMQIVDTNGSGNIEFTQFIVAALGSKEYTVNHFQQAFAYFDIQHTGFITFEQIAAFLQNKEHSQTQIRKLFEVMDQNDDGVISKEEFLHVLMGKDGQTPKRSHKKVKSK